MTELDILLEELITRINKTEQENLKLKALVKSLKRTIEGLKDDKRRDIQVPDEHEGVG